MAWQDRPSSKAFVSVAVPYSSVPQMNKVLLLQRREYLANTSADRTQPIMLPRCGTLLTYGKAEVINTFFSPGIGNLKKIYTTGLFHAYLELSETMKFLINGILNTTKPTFSNGSVLNCHYYKP